LHVSEADRRLAHVSEADRRLPQDGGSDLHFLMYGDWGEPVHSKNAKSMADFAHSQKSDFMLALGDNFYDDGVESTKDKKWKNIFEDIYTQDSLQFPWRAILGNHDYKGNPAAQVDYTQSSDRWYMPSRYYSFSYRTKTNMTALFVGIDTIELVGEVKLLSCPSGGDYDSEGVWLCSFRYEALKGERSSEQWSWIENTLQYSSEYDWVFVFGHYPIFSTGEHGSTEKLEPLRQLLERYNVSAYFAGHDHGMQALSLNGVVHVGSGAGAKCSRMGINKLPHNLDVEVNFLWPEKKEDYHTCLKHNSRSLAFTGVRLTKELFEFEFVGSHTGEVLYREKVPNIRKCGARC